MTETDTRNIEVMDTVVGDNADGERIAAMDEDHFRRYIKSLIVSFDGHRRLAGDSQASKTGSQVPNRYDFDHPRRGLAIIYNNENFKNDIMLPRIGSSEDAKNLEVSFRSLGFDVLVFNDFTSNYMLIAAKEAAKWYQHDEADCFVCAILSHGMEVTTTKSHHNIDGVAHCVYGYDNGAVFSQDLYNIFDSKNCKGLSGKPRLFFVQACRGNKMDSGVRIKEGSNKEDNDATAPKLKTDDKNLTDQLLPCYTDMDSPDAQLMSDDDDDEEHRYLERQMRLTWRRMARNMQMVRMLPIPLEDDSLMMYGTPPGYFAWRRDTGSWFITELCNFLRSKQVLQESFLWGLTSVCRNVAEKYKSQTHNSSMSNKVAMPTLDFMLTKDIVMTPKDPVIDKRN